MKIFTSSKFVLSPFHAGFTARFGNLSASLFAVIFTLLSMAAFSQGGQKFSDAGNILSTSSFIGSTNAMPFVIKTNNTQKAVFTTAGWFGLGITAPSCMFDVFGDGKILNFNIVSNLVVGNSLSVKKIFSPTGTVNFDGSNLTTTAKFTGSSIYFTGANQHITSSTGTVDFDGNNLTTTAGIKASTLSISGNGTFNNLSVLTDITSGGTITAPQVSSNNVTANTITTSDLSVTGTFSANSITSTGNLNLNNNNITNANTITANTFQSPLFAGTGNGLILSDANGSFQKLDFDGNQNTYLRGDGTFGSLSGTSTWDTIYANAIIGGYVNATKSIQLDGSITAGSRGTGAIGEYSIVVGGPEPMYGYTTSPVASGKYSVSFGTANESTNLGSMSFGGGNVSSGLFSFAIGGNNISNGNLSFAIGSGNTASGSNSTVIGKDNISEGKQSAIIGGMGNTITVDATNSAIIGGTGITATQPNTVYVPNLISNGNIGIGVESPIEKLDVQGNANIRGYLYVQDGVIIGKRIDGQRVNSDTIDVKKLAIKYATTDSLTSLKLMTKELEAKTMLIEKVTADTLKTENMTLLLMEADSITAQKMTLDKLAINNIKADIEITSKEINIGEKGKFGNNIVIDGLTNNITTPGSITAGNITAGTMNVTNVTVDSSVVNTMQVVNQLKIGTNSLYLGSNPDPFDPINNDIYTDTYPLRIQCKLAPNSTAYLHTILNALPNLGNVGIGTDDPQAKLDILGTFRLRGNGAGTNKILTSDASGFATWQDPVSITGTGVTGTYPNYQINDNTVTYIGGTGINISGSQITNTAPDQTVNLTGTGATTVTGTYPNFTITSTDNNTLYAAGAGININGGIISSTNSNYMAGTGLSLSADGTTLNSVWTKNNDDIFSNASGNIGIGTSDPQKKLHVRTTHGQEVVGDISGSFRLENIVTPGSTSTWDFEPWASAAGDFINRLSIGTPDNPILTINQLGRVGIGVTIPTEKLEVNGHIKITDGSQHANWILTSDNTGKGTWTDPSLVFAEKWQSGNGNNGTDIFYNTTGNVGIGTSLPTLAKLHVKDDISAQVFVIEGGETGTYMSWYHQNRQAWAGFYTNDNFELKNETPNGHILLSTTGTGKIGIGTYTPTEKLHIKDGSIYIDGEGQGLIVNEGGHKRVGFMKYEGKEAGIWRVANQDFEIGRLDDNTITGNHSNYYTDIYIKGDGNVGIGTTTPLSKLHIKSDGGTLSLEGNNHTYIQFFPDGPATRRAWVGFGSVNDDNFTISNEFSGKSIKLVTIGGGTVDVSNILRARKVIVNNTWSDFVFNHDYSLKPLSEVEDYIKQNCHLPGVPSAAEVEDNGLDLGEINKIMMQKIEELTLYSIEQQKQIEQLKQLIEQFSNNK